MKVRNHKIYTEVVWEWNESTQQLEQISEQSELYSGNLALAGQTFGDCEKKVAGVMELTCEGGSEAPNGCHITDDMSSMIAMWGCDGSTETQIQVIHHQGTNDTQTTTSACCIPINTVSLYFTDWNAENSPWVMRVKMVQLNYKL